MSVTPQGLRISSAQGDYPVEFPSSFAAALAAVMDLGDPFFLVDRNVRSLYRTEIDFALAGRKVLELDATEEEKTLAGVTKVVTWLQANGCNKKSTVVAIGGGIIQDLATFSSHIYYRGVPWAFIPTTLLSMSDSCIGAKCGINLGELKNQLGVFQSPLRVIISTDLIRTLSDRDVASGYGEILKLMLTADEGGFHRLAGIVDAEGLRTPRLAELIRSSLDVKRAVIEEDEYESDLRRILNYGHTFGHALESLTRHEVPHGLAVAWGIDFVNYLAVARGLLARETFDEIHRFIVRHLPFTRSAPVTAPDLIVAARRDKKAAGGEVNLILLERPGALRIVKVAFDAELERQTTEYLEHHDAFRGH